MNILNSKWYVTHAAVYNLQLLNGDRPSSSAKLSAYRAGHPSGASPYYGYHRVSFRPGGNPI